jgi:glycosyltransferase involved in cell wall biosynthesis
MLQYLYLTAGITAFAYTGIVLFLRHGLLKLKPSGNISGLKYSVVIAARNEELCIANCLEHVFDQTISTDRFEVVLILDRCEDQTRQIAEAVPVPDGLGFHIIEIHSVPPGNSPKKYALTAGIDHSQNEIIVFTDADCTVPVTWLSAIDRNFGPGVNVVQGITAYEKNQSINPMLFGFQAVDFISHGIVSAAAIGAGLPINSNANNMAVRRSSFFEAKGYGNKAGIVSGDDDLLLQRIYKKHKGCVRYMTDAEGSVTTLATLSASGVFEQRKRWSSKTVHYGLPQVFMLSMIFLFYATIAVFGVLAIFVPAALAGFAMLFSIKIFGELLLMIPGTRMLHHKELRPWILPASILQLPMVLIAVVSGVFGRFEWKGTRYRRKV